MITSPASLRRLLTFTTALTMVAQVLPAAAQDDSSAPPARVGQIAALAGNVSFNGSGSGGWAQAALNYPVTSGDTLYTQDGARTAIALDYSRITLAADTELQVTNIDQNDFAATQSQGEAVYAIDYLQPGQEFTITTPRGTVGITRNGQYDIAAGDSGTPTTVNVYQGEATVTDPGASLDVAPGQAAYLSGASQTVAQIGQAQQDSFAESVLARNAPPPPSYAPPVVQQMTGVSELGEYGSWDQSPQYGAVWYPQVGAGWAPYRQGHWADIRPWGWTWVESEPWGFAPFHYGRWIDNDGRWGWAPAPAYSDGGYGPSYRPVYAPAVVSFFGVAVAAGITAAALSSGSVGWVPLAPDEPYYPTYHCPPAYIRRINVVNVRNINTINVTNNYYGGNFTPDRLANRGGATFVPAGVMSRGEHVAGYAHPAPAAMLAAARPMDMGFGAHPGQPAAFRLPPAATPLARMHPGIAPRPTDFAQRRELPPATVSHAPFTGHPAGMAAPLHEMPPMQAVNRPGFAATPGYHAPPPPPAGARHLGALPPAQHFQPAADHAMPQIPHPGAAPGFHPQGQPHPMAAVQPAGPPAGVYHPSAPAYHPPAEPNHAPVHVVHPSAPAYHPPAPAYHPPAQVFHPAPEAARPPAQQFHPQPMAQPRPAAMPHVQPMPHAEPPHEDHRKHPA